MTPVDTKFGSVAAGHAETSKAAMTTLEAGGNAFDAVIAGFLAACVAEPVLASLGGGGFVVAHTEDGDMDVFDFFTNTPLAKPDPAIVNFEKITADFGAAQQDFHIGLGSVATPGAVAGIFELHNAYGAISMADIAAPAIALAKEGVILSGFQAYLLSVVAPIYNHTEEARAQFCRNQSSFDLLSEGARYHPERFADFLTVLADEGTDLFYRGDVAAKLEATEGCSIGRNDLATYSVQRRKPETAAINGHQVYLNPPPAVGGALIALALDDLDAREMAALSYGDAAHVQALVRVMQRCNELRIESGIDIDPEGGARRLRELAGHPPSYRGTTHISVADARGNMAAMTVSNGEGCGYMIPDTGIMLNNMLGEEDLNQQGFFEWQEGVRMSSMMTPGIMRAPSGAWTAFGSGGSNRIRSAITQVLLNLSVFAMNEQEAVAASRLHLEGEKLSAEPGFDADAFDTVAGLVADVHMWPQKNMFFGGTHVVTRHPDGRMTGAGDERRDGVWMVR